jgi:hypothetical protein
MTTTQDPNITSTDIKAGMTNSMSASVMLQTYTNTVLQTPIIKLDPSVDTDSKSTVVEDLPVHQALAQTNAQNYLNKVNPLIISTVADVIGFGNLWNAEYATLYALAQNISQGNNAQTFTTGMNNLIAKTQNAEANTQPVIDALNAFLPLIQTDDRNLKQDYNNVGIALGGEGGAITQLENQLQAYNDAMNKDMAIIAAGATADIVGALMIVVGLLAEIETAGLATGLVVAGIAVVAGGTTAMGVAGADYTKSQQAYKSTLTTLNADKQVYTLSSQASKTVASLVDAISQGISAVESLQKGWGSLQADFNQVVQALEQADDPSLGSWLTDLLSAANTDWADTLALAKNLQLNGTIPVQKSSN